MITADEMIEAYVSDVVLLLPRKQRRDVAQELRALLGEEIDGAAAQHSTREEAARAVLTGFGRPAEVAARYGSPVTLIDAADTRQFITLAVAGAALILLAGAFNEFLEGARRDSSWILVFAWWGVLVAGFAAANAIRRRGKQPVWTPHRVPSDRINRLGRALGIIFFTAGTVILAAPQWALRQVSGGRAAQAAYDAFIYDTSFRRLGGPIVLALLIFGILIQAVLVVHGRWRPWVRTTEVVYGVVLCLTLTAVLAAGPVYQATPTDQVARGAVAVIVLITLADLAVRARRESVRQAVRS